MVIIKLSGGLGNQMFQYACGRYLSQIKNTELKFYLGFLLEGSESPDFTFREYQLNVFNLHESFASETEVQTFKKPSSFFKKNIFKIKQLIHPDIIISEKSFESAIRQKVSNIYAKGYFQSEKYFPDIRNILVTDFALKQPLDNDCKRIANSIAACSSVSIHIRRGDYVSNSHINKYHGICSLVYYNNAMNLISEKVADPHFFVFSDDLNWAKENIKPDWPITFVDGFKNYEDMFLMSSCKHNIIANSSFSWWAAWLNSNIDKIVIAPLNWFRNKNVDSADIIPPTWIRLD